MVTKEVSIPGNGIETGISSRLREIQGSHSAAEIARKCGVGESLWRKYLAGSTPGLDRAEQIASRAGVCLQWLATGRGPKFSSELSEQVDNPKTAYVYDAKGYYSFAVIDKNIPRSPETLCKVDQDLLREAVSMVLEAGDGSSAGHRHERSAALIAICYQALLAGMSSDLMHELLAVSMRQPD